jgi:hypothetical protein
LIRSAARSRQTTVPAVLALALCAVTGVTMSVQAPAAPLVAAAAMLVALSLDWRRGVVALLVVLPFAGLPVFVAGTPGLAFRDLAVVGPLYITFAAAMLRSDTTPVPPLGIALPALVLFAALVVAGVAVAPSLSVGVLGMKVWLVYMPMLAIGYHFIRRVGDLDRVLAMTAVLGLLPAALALAELLLAARTGSFGPFAHLYSSTASAPSMLVFGDGAQMVKIARVPSTFTSGSSYYTFALVAFVAALSQLLRHGGRGWFACTVMLAAGAGASGNRAAYVMVPLITVVSLAFAGVRPSRLASAGAASGAMVLAVAALGGNPLLVLRLLPEHVHVTLSYGWHEMRSSFLLLGHGTGWDTNGALRYGDTAQRRYIENWYAKASLELGVLGLLSITVALASIIVRLVTPLRRLDARPRQLAAPVAALLLLTVVSLFKGPYIDLDPLNVYFWLFAGMLLGLYRAVGAVPGLGAKAAAL